MKPSPPYTTEELLQIGRQASPPAVCAVLSCREPRSGDPQCPFYCAEHLRMWRETDRRSVLTVLHSDDERLPDVEVGG